MPTDAPAAIQATSEPAKQRESSRLAGIDLFRGVAAFGVIVIHAGLAFEGQVTSSVSALQRACNLFCVPFFLASAFYFAIARSLAAGVDEPGFTWLRKRAGRLLVPYAAWTLIYLGALALKLLLVAPEPAGLARLAVNPWGRLLLGGSGVHLYFIPLLLIGLALARALSRVLREQPVPLLAAFAVLTLILAETTIQTGNSFNLGRMRAFEPVLTLLGGSATPPAWSDFGPVRTLLVMLAHAIRCLPYLFLTALWLRGRAAAKAFTASQTAA